MIYIVSWQMLWELVGNLSCKFLIPAVLEASSWGGGVPQGRWSTHLPTCQTCTRRREEALTWRCHSGFRVCISMTQSLDSFTKMHVQPRLLCCQRTPQKSHLTTVSINVPIHIMNRAALGIIRNSFASLKNGRTWGNDLISLSNGCFLLAPALFEV